MAGWLEISTSGFAAFNSARKPGHLVKELVQNAFDAIGERGGTVRLDYRTEGSGFLVECRDDGDGIADLDAIRVVYLTFKKDSHLKRGRFGRGFKEVLSVATSARVESGTHAIDFVVENEKQVAKLATPSKPRSGTLVSMTLPFPAETIDEFDAYFSTFLVPPKIELLLNGRSVGHRLPKLLVEASLSTELYHGDSQSWRKPKRPTQIELVQTRAGEQASIYEMGIPVASAEWSVPYHANILQRVPMNPNRDALASGYARTVHAAALPVLLPLLEAEDATADWVGAAGVACDETVQKEILAKAFGGDAVRAVPTMGKRDFNDDAARMGADVVFTNQMSAGFREMAKLHMPTAKEKVDVRVSELRESAARSSFTLDSLGGEADQKLVWIERRGRSKHVGRVLEFAVWFCQHLVDSCPGVHKPVTGALALGNTPTLLNGATGGPAYSTFLAHWNADNVLTLALEWETIWRDPLGEEALAVLIHEAAHAQNLHHGRGFVAEVERLAGVAAATMFEHADEIRARWPELIARNDVDRAGSATPSLPNRLNSTSANIADKDAPNVAPAPKPRWRPW